MVQNKGIIFKDVPTHEPVPGKHLAIEAREFDLDQAPPEGGITTKNYYASYDPYQRGRMKAPDAKHYHAPFTLGKPIDNSVIAKVLKSDNPKFQEGDLISVMTGLEEYSVVEKGKADTMVTRKINNPYKLDPIIFLGALGMPGMTAYSSLYEIGKPKKGEVIFISAASGAVGQLVGQLAKHEGLTVLGSVGSDDKLKFILEELGFDGGFNYKKEKPSEALARLAPKGLDIYYENVGGEQLEAALGAMKERGRIVACGMVSQYNKPPNEVYGIKNLSLVVGKRLSMRGFIVSDPDFGPAYVGDLHKNVGKWISDKTFKAQYSVTDGIDNGVEGLIGMLRGENFGKAVLKIADLD